MTDPTTFFQALDSLSSGERVALKRAAGTMLADADGRAMAAFYSCLPYEVEYQQDRWFAAACFHCLWDADGQPGLAMEQAFRKLFQEAGNTEGSESLKRRMASLLDTDWTEDGYLLMKLNRGIRMLRQKEYRIDCAALLKDLLNWDTGKQFVQRKWARGLYQKPQPQEGES